MRRGDPHTPGWSSSSHNVRFAVSRSVVDKHVERPLVSTAEVLIGHGHAWDLFGQHTVM